MKRNSQLSARNDATNRLNHLFPPLEESCRLAITCARADFSASLIARAVEDCDAHLLNLNVTAPTASAMAEGDARVNVELRISHRDGMAVARSLERYGFEVVSIETAGPSADTARDRVNQLIRYLEV